MRLRGLLQPIDYQGARRELAKARLFYVDDSGSPLCQKRRT
jgi:hypothetical protein